MRTRTRTRTPTPTPTTAPTPTPRAGTVAAVTCAVLLTATATACLPEPAGAGAGPSPSAAAPDPFAGRDPAAVLRAAYEETERAATRTAVVSRRLGEREITAQLTFEGDGGCWGEVRVERSGTGEILVDDAKVSLRGDAGFLQDQFRNQPVKSPDTADGWIDMKPGDPAVSHLVALCADGSPARTFPAERTGLRREPDTRLNGRPVAVLVSKGPGGVEITDHVSLDGRPYLVRHAETGPEGRNVTYGSLP
ncbi:hypothetical protein [Streptomyces sp. NPDC127112]|uniref:hypothetical protein n=1 Tax=Streptomyces sp. NPDC127112 TaxID=3345364 RepID=UPI00362692CE